MLPKTEMSFLPFMVSLLSVHLENVHQVLGGSGDELKTLSGHQHMHEQIVRLYGICARAQ